MKKIKKGIIFGKTCALLSAGMGILTGGYYVYTHEFSWYLTLITAVICLVWEIIMGITYDYLNKLEN